MNAVRSLAAATVVFFACGGAPPAPTPREPERVPPEAVAEPDPSDDFALVELDRGCVYALDAPIQVRVSPDVLELTGGDAPMRLALRDGHVPPEALEESDSTNRAIRPLRDALVGTAPAKVDLFVDGGVPYRTLIEIVFTLGQASLHDLRLAVVLEGRVGGLEILLPMRAPDGRMMRIRAWEWELGPTHCRQPRPVARPESEPGIHDVTVVLTREGAIVTTSEGKLGPDCVEVRRGRVVTLEASPNTPLDPARLDACLEVIARRSSDSLFIVMADPSIPFARVARAIVAGAPNFEPLLGAGVR